MPDTERIISEIQQVGTSLTQHADALANHAAADDTAFTNIQQHLGRQDEHLRQQDQRFEAQDKRFDDLEASIGRMTSALERIAKWPTIIEDGWQDTKKLVKRALKIAIVGTLVAALAWLGRLLTVGWKNLPLLLLAALLAGCRSHFPSRVVYDVEVNELPNTEAGNAHATLTMTIKEITP